MHSNAKATQVRSLGPSTASPKLLRPCRQRNDRLPKLRLSMRGVRFATKCIYRIVRHLAEAVSQHTKETPMLLMLMRALVLGPSLLRNTSVNRQHRACGLVMAGAKRRHHHELHIHQKVPYLHSTHQCSLLSLVRPIHLMNIKPHRIINKSPQDNTITINAYITTRRRL